MKNRWMFLMVMLGVCNAIAQQKILTPNEAVKLALDNNYGIKLANNQLEVAKNNASILNAGYLPSITGNAGASIDKQDSEGELANGEVRSAKGAETRRYNASINLNYTLFDGLGRSYDYKQLKERYQLTELQAKETIENTVFQLFSIYYDVAQLTENTLALEQTLTISNDRLLRAKYQFDYGQSTKLGVLNAEVDINNDSINLINAKQQLKNFKRDLNVVLGNVIAHDFDVDTAINFDVLFIKEELFEKAKTRNIALLQVEKNINISQFDIKTNKAQLFPTIGVVGSYGWNESSNNSPLAFTLQNTSSGVTGGLNLTWNLFDGGSTMTRIKNAQINLESQKLQKEQLLDDVERNFYNAWDDYQNKYNIYKIQENNILTSQNNFDRTQEKFKLGQVNSIEFRQAQLNLLNAELSRNQAKYQAKLAELQMLQISGELLNVNF
ncbi:MAG: TolC family protein [Flavobacteriales bacterium]|nr:TolC family protein [Flavobacteriia bacterium]NCP05967.1 TolC family protein [Flavobacteriales bacterium]PIV94416.1 MAG: transporter [Flavobacteriaceae bacterium CG17_big_fil_post_rev_8_21_14_2_50_33_15]PIY10024.1 MAG: transporter [Flavobacteriaceae bacterium CG_4_10_14_3_um_filter_33_47]PJB17597.1 MAG: transporter [Flavobacteriaceae bacterium CG_4_9_14_3_um_filter_33_16]